MHSGRKAIPASVRILSLYTIALLTAGSGALAQVPGPAGQAWGQIQQLPPPPVLQRSIPEIRIQRSQAPAALVPGVAATLANTLHVTVDTKFSEAENIAPNGFR